jgi:hypothetical protein
MAGYYRHFIKNYGIICGPLFDALKKDAFHWSPAQQQSFEEIKLIMSAPPVLALPNFTLPCLGN